MYSAERRSGESEVHRWDLRARVVCVRRLRPGEYAGYGLAFQAERETVLAVLSIGYADGLPRELSSGRGHVLIHGKKAPVIGRICMDQTLVDVSEIPEASGQDTAVLIGSSGPSESCFSVVLGYPGLAVVRELGSDDDLFSVAYILVVHNRISGSQEHRITRSQREMDFEEF